ncbi:hypothetical protein ABZ590_40265, partial [Streptomyces hirsutus]|uniref:hypothetical protein n=1 Tax=Streptomyces hirsutus TaxID=35620 RepID=UPI00340B935C
MALNPPRRSGVAHGSGARGRSRGGGVAGRPGGRHPREWAVRYSTIGQLGYMTGALAVDERGAAVFHL